MCRDCSGVRTLLDSILFFVVFFFNSSDLGISMIMATLHYNFIHFMDGSLGGPGHIVKECPAMGPLPT